MLHVYGFFRSHAVMRIKCKTDKPEQKLHALYLYAHEDTEGGGGGKALIQLSKYLSTQQEPMAACGIQSCSASKIGS